MITEKKKYDPAEIEIIPFNDKDIITTSNPDTEMPPH